MKRTANPFLVSMLALVAFLIMPGPPQCMENRHLVVLSRQMQVKRLG